MSELTSHVADRLRSVFAMDACVIRLLDGEDLVLLACTGLPDGSCPERIPVGCGIASEILKRQSPLFILDMMSHPALAPERSHPPDPRSFVSYAGAPMLAGDCVIGILGLFSRTRREDLTQTDLDGVQLMANNVSLAIANERLYGQLAREHHRLEGEIATRIQVEQHLKDNEERLRLAARAARMFAFEWDPATDLAVRSAECADILGLDGVCDTGQAYLAGIQPDDRSNLIEMLEQLSPASPGYRASYRVIRPDGKVVWLEESALGFFDADGMLVKLIGMVADVTERREAEHELRQLREELARMVRITAMGELTATIAHQVNQPLGAVMANAQACQRILNESAPDLGEIRHALADIADDAWRATQVVDQVRGFLGKAEPHCCLIDVNGVIRQVVRMLDDRMKADQVSVRLRLGRDLPPVSGNETQLQQVVLNLLTNAIEAVGQTHVACRKVVISSRLADGAAIVIAVKDFGPGLPAADLERIFTPFFTTRPRGIGMGLAICRSIVEAHRGRLWAESAEGAGSVFRFTIPVQREDAP